MHRFVFAVAVLFLSAVVCQVGAQAPPNQAKKEPYNIFKFDKKDGDGKGYNIFKFDKKDGDGKGYNIFKFEGKGPPYPTAGQTTAKPSEEDESIEGFTAKIRKLKLKKLELIRDMAKLELDLTLAEDSLKLLKEEAKKGKADDKVTAPKK